MYFNDHYTFSNNYDNLMKVRKSNFPSSNPKNASHVGENKSNR